MHVHSDPQPHTPQRKKLIVVPRSHVQHV
jgi:hypothetical protein